MPEALTELPQGRPVTRHARWVRVSHWIATATVLALAFSGFVILMAHPRLYWGVAGNDLTPALLELPISRNYKHAGYEDRAPFFGRADGPVSANRTYDIFNENGWARSLHFLAAWGLVLVGAAYLGIGLLLGHFRAHIWPRAAELRPHLVWQDVIDHLRFLRPPAAGGPRYNLLQKAAYSLVLFVAVPLVVLTGLAMSPAVTAALPVVERLFGGYQSARTLHFLAFAGLLLFVFVHVVMVTVSGFWRQVRAMTFGG